MRRVWRRLDVESDMGSLSLVLLRASRPQEPTAAQTRKLPRKDKFVDRLGILLNKANINSMTEIAVPHIQIDYSANLETRLDVAGLCRVLRDAAVETGVLPLAGIRVRATACTHSVIADGNPDHAFLDISLRLRGGRTTEAKQQATAHIFAAAETYCAAVLESSSFMLSFEMRDIDPALSPKTSSIRRYLSGENS